MVDRTALVKAPGNSAWIYDPTRNEIDFISTSKGSLYSYGIDQEAFTRTLTIGGSPNVLAITPDGKDLLIGNVAGPNSGDATLTVTRVNLATNAIDHVLTQGASSTSGVSSLVVDVNGLAHFNTRQDYFGKGFFAFDAESPNLSGHDDTTFNALIDRSFHMGANSYLLTSPDHRFVLFEDVLNGSGRLTLYDTQAGALVGASSASAQGPGGGGRGDITSSGLIAIGAKVYDSHIQLVKDLSGTLPTGASVIGSVFSQDARDLFVWDEHNQKIFVYDTQTWEKVGSLTTLSGGMYQGASLAPMHDIELVDHGGMLAIDDGVHGVELIDLVTRLGLSPGVSHAADPTLSFAVNPQIAHYITANGDMDGAHLSDLLAATITQADDTGFAASGLGALSVSLHGTQLSYTSNRLVGGTVTSVEFTDVQDGATTLHFAAYDGSWSAPVFQTWLVTNNASAAFQTILAGNDWIYGGRAGDVIHSYGGDDVIEGEGGGDTLYGGAGNDVIYAALSPNNAVGFVPTAASTYLRGEDGNDYIVGGAGFDDINGNMGNDTASGGLGDDWVVGGRDNDLLFGDAGNDIVYGNMGNDTCVGGEGADQIRGGQANDVLYGGSGNDWLSGDRGDDTLSGGLGADVFHSFSGAGIDRVLDFVVSEGDRVQLDPGTTYSVSQVGADTIVDLGGGDKVILVGVQMNSLPQGWIFIA